jgi:hypothetical protein
MLVRIVAGLVGLFYTLNGLQMIAAPESWFALVSRSDPIGAYNHHLVTDVGLAFLAGGLAFFAFAGRPERRLIAFGASGFMVFHALFHLIGFLSGEGHALTIGWIGLPAMLAVAISWPRAGEA